MSIQNFAYLVYIQMNTSLWNMVLSDHISNGTLGSIVSILYKC